VYSYYARVQKASKFSGATSSPDYGHLVTRGDVARVGRTTHDAAHLLVRRARRDRARGVHRAHGQFRDRRRRGARARARSPPRRSPRTRRRRAPFAVPSRLLAAARASSRDLRARGAARRREASIARADDRGASRARREPPARARAREISRVLLLLLPARSFCSNIFIFSPRPPPQPPRTTRQTLPKILDKLSAQSKFTLVADHHTFNYLADDGYVFLVVADEEFGRQARSTSHWSPYDPVGVVNAVP